MASDVVFEHPDWRELGQPPVHCESGWEHREGLVIGLHHFGPDPGLRERMSQIGAVRDYYRAGFAKDGLGLVECDVHELDGVPVVRAIGKTSLDEGGAAYAGTIAMPLPKESYVFNLGAREGGITGIRETAVVAITMREMEQQGFALDMPSSDPSSANAGAGKAPIMWRNSATGSVLRWAQDPYDPDWDGPCLRNLADAPEHDAGFPEHPLSQVRVALQSLFCGVRFSAELKRRARGKKRWGLW